MRFLNYKQVPEMEPMDLTNWLMIDVCNNTWIVK